MKLVRRRQTWIVRGIVALIAIGFGLASCAGGGGGGKGKKLYQHYCMHCHGENGQQNEGFNWASMPDPRPKDLSAQSEMGTFSDEEIFHTIYRDMKDTTPEIGDTIGDDEFAVPTMPTFKFTLSQKEIWAIVGYVRSLHGMSLTYDTEGHLKELQGKAAEAQAAFDQAKKALEEAQAKADAEEEARIEAGEEDYEAPELVEEETAANAEVAFEKAKKELESFKKRPKQAHIQREEFNVSEEEAAALAETGKRLYENKYGCNGCHAIGGTGGLVGPPLDRAGFRLNAPWIYKWIKYPQSIKKKTRMPNLGVTDEDGRALTMYLKTLQAPKPTEPAPPPE